MQHPELVSLREFARRKNWNPGYAHKLKAAGRLVMVDGKVDVDASERSLAESSDPAREHLRRNATAGSSSDHGSSGAGQQHAGGGQAFSSNATFSRAKTATQVFDAKLRELEYKERIRDLVPARDVAEMQFTAGRITRDRVLMVPARVAPELHAMLVAGLPEDVRQAASARIHDVEKALNDYLREALTSAAREIEEAGATDDDGAGG